MADETKLSHTTRVVERASHRLHQRTTMSRLRRTHTAALLSALAFAVPADAQVSWTDWTSSNAGAGTVTGSMTFGATTVGVTFSGGFLFAQTSCGTNYFAPNVYTSVAVPTAPTPCDIIAMNAGGVKTITFSQAVVNPVFALVSWNSQTGTTFSGAIQVLSQGTGYWGAGTLGVSGTNPNAIVTSGEAHGTIRILGTVTSVTFTDRSENWHGITVGAQNLPVTVVPEPQSYVLVATGLLGVLAARRRVRA
jgi:hypothetical protein